MILFNTVKWTFSKSNRFVLWLIDHRPYSLIFISEYEMLPTFGGHIELSHALRCHDITTSNGSIFRHISKVHCFISSLLHIKQYNMVHIIWFIIWNIFLMKNFQEDEIAQPVLFRKPLKIEFYNR